MRIFLNFRFLIIALTVCFSSPLAATVYFVDSQNGSDAASGLSESLAWQSLTKVNKADLKPGDIVKFARGGLWRGSLKAKSGTADAPITYTCYGPENLPKPRLYGSLSLNSLADWEKMETNLWRTIQPVTEAKSGTLSDVGNLIFDGKSSGVKCWSKEQFKTTGCFWFDPETRYVWLYSVNNPAGKFNEIEAALRGAHVVNLANASNVVISDFDVRYGAAHGICGSNTSFTTIRDCDISWIGGGHQKNQANGDPVRFGNGIEFWDTAHDILVEGCRIWEIYDAGVTNQGSAKNEQRNITYRNNTIWNCEYSFEYWNGPAESVTDNIVFTQNMCYNAGSGWGHAQRPDPNGRHVMFWNNTAKITNVVVTDNVFAYASESLMWSSSATWWKTELTFGSNIWFQRSDGLYVVEGMAGYQKNPVINTSNESAPTYDRLSIYQWQISTSNEKQVDVSGKHADIQWSKQYADEFENLNSSGSSLSSQDLVLVHDLSTNPQHPSARDVVYFNHSLSTNQAITAGTQSRPVQNNTKTISFLQYLGEAAVVYWVWNEYGDKEISDQLAVQVYQIVENPLASHPVLNVTYIPTLTLADLNAQLLNGCVWAEPSTRLEVGDNQQFLATYTVPGGNGQSVTGYITVNVVKAEEATITTQPVGLSVDEGSNYTLIVTAANAIGYQWQKLNGNMWTDIFGATSATYTINAAIPADAGSYRVVVSGLDNTVTSAIVIVTVNDATSISILPSASFLVYPNPVRKGELLTVQTGTEASFMDEFEISIYDLNGKLQKQYHRTQTEISIPAPDNAGYYVLRLNAKRSGMVQQATIVVR
ncbi:MAG: T9SS type A sorting domain-containing protein [Tannerella sp.]|jgi:hypothetical protein|nr:T9SS type A sorting domain-containing protein [Tannerella sp.]